MGGPPAVKEEELIVGDALGDSLLDSGSGWARGVVMFDVLDTVGEG
jgi:hypothetical protein